MAIKRIQRGRNHSYTINERKAVGVTTALSKGLPKPALVRWSARETAAEAVKFIGMHEAAKDDWGVENGIEVYSDEFERYLAGAPFRKRDKAAVRGTKVHKFADSLVRGDDVDVPEELAPFVENTLKFFSDWNVRPVLTERPVGSYAWGYAGTFDLIADVKTGQRVLFDYKTSNAGIFPETALQLAAYRYADAYVGTDGVTEIPMREVGINACKAVWLRADGYDVIPLVADENAFKLFLHVLAVARGVETLLPTLRGEAEFAP